MTPIAMAGMGAEVAAVVLLLLGVLVLDAARSSRAEGKHRWMLAVAAFLGGPVLALMFWALYVITAAERFADLWTFLIIGGVVGVFAITIGNVVRRMTSGRGGEQEHTR